MRAAVLTSGSPASPGWHVRDLQRAANPLGLELVPCHWRHLQGSIDTHHPTAMAGELLLDDMDLVLLRTMPAGSLEEIILRMDIVGQLAQRGVKVVNSPKAIEAAVDKYLALSRMAQAGLPVPRTIACQRFDEAIAAFEILGGDVVVKPLFGSEGFGIMRLNDADLAGRTFAQLDRLNQVIYLQKYIEHHGQDYRLLVLAERVIGAMKRTHASDWRTNIARGGAGQPIEPAAEHARLAIAAACVCDTFIAGVDVMVDDAGKVWVIEVNAVPGWRELSKVTGIDIASRFLQEVMK